MGTFTVGIAVLAIVMLAARSVCKARKQGCCAGCAGCGCGGAETDCGCGGEKNGE